MLSRHLTRFFYHYCFLGQEASSELLRNVENERASLKNEFDQERIAYQKLLKAYNKLEAQYENSQDELNALKNPDGMAFDRYKN